MVEQQSTQLNLVYNKSIRVADEVVLLIIIHSDDYVEKDNEVDADEEDILQRQEVMEEREIAVAQDVSGEFVGDDLMAVSNKAATQHVQRLVATRLKHIVIPFTISITRIQISFAFLKIDFNYPDWMIEFTDWFSKIISFDIVGFARTSVALTLSGPRS